MEGFNPTPPQEEPKELVVTSIEVNESLKRKGLDFTESLRTLNVRINKVDKEAEVVSPRAVGGFKVAARNLEEIFSSQEINLDDAVVSFGRLTTSFEDLSLIQDGELRKITDDARKSLVHAIEGSMDSATALRMEESMESLRKNINNMINKADEAAQRLRRGARS